MGIRDVKKFSVQNWDMNTQGRSNPFFSVFFHPVYEEFIQSTHLGLGDQFFERYLKHYRQRFFGGPDEQMKDY